MKLFLKKNGKFLLFIAILWIIPIFLLGNVSIEGHSMEPTLKNGEKIIISKIFTIKRYDIIVSKEPDQNVYMIKRVIGMPGDTVIFQDDTLIVNGKIQNEDYLNDFKKKFNTDRMKQEFSYNSTYQKIAQQSKNFTRDFETQVPSDKYLVLGDNRLISKDSRFFGFVDKDLVKGKLIFKYWPLLD